MSILAIIATIILLGTVMREDYHLQFDLGE